LIWKVLNVTNSHVTNSRYWPLPTKRNLAGARITASRPRNYGSLKMPSIRAKNRSKSEAKIWSEAKNVVPLQSIREMLCECGLRLSIARARSALRSPCTTLALSGQSGRRLPDVVSRKVSLIPRKMRFSESRAMPRISSAEREHLRW